MMQKMDVLMLTTQPLLWTRWQELQKHGCRPVWGEGPEDIAHWLQSGGELVVMDAGLPCLPPWSAACWTEHFQDVKVLVLSASLSDEEGHLVLSKGACGYGYVHMDVDAIARILWSLQQGTIWVGRSLLQKLLKDIDERLPRNTNSENWAQSLSAREEEVAALASIGQSNADIAASLSITERTVRAHLSAVFDKLAIADRLQLALKVHGIKK